MKNSLLPGAFWAIRHVSKYSQNFAVASFVKTWILKYKLDSKSDVRLHVYGVRTKYRPQTSKI